MDRRSFLASMISVGASAMFSRSSLGESLPPTAQASPSGQAEAIRTTASQFLRTLSPDRRRRVSYAFPSHEVVTKAVFPRQRMGGKPAGGANGDAGSHPMPAGQPFVQHPGGGPGMGPEGGFIGEKYGQSVWSNFPVSDVPRPGLRMGEFASAERDAVHGLLRVVLSPMGSQKVLDIMEADQTLADTGVPYAAGLDAYTLALFGEPSATAPWMLQFGGHHLGLNVTFVGDKTVLAPLHTGILPARFQADGKTIRALGRENDKAFDLLATFTSEQLKSTIIDHNVSELVCGPGRPHVTFPPVGLRGAGMTETQRKMMFELAREWVGILNDAQAAPRLEEIRGALPDTYFAWSGPRPHELGENGESYFRIHGPSLLIEHAPQGNQGGYKLHVHTVVRDLNNDYARQLV
jgi:hypothetical protein